MKLLVFCYSTILGFRCPCISTVWGVFGSYQSRSAPASIHMGAPLSPTNMSHPLIIWSSHKSWATPLRKIFSGSSAAPKNYFDLLFLDEIKALKTRHKIPTTFNVLSACPHPMGEFYGFHTLRLDIMQVLSFPCSACLIIITDKICRLGTIKQLILSH